MPTIVDGRKGTGGISPSSILLWGGLLGLFIAGLAAGTWTWKQRNAVEAVLESQASPEQGIAKLGGEETAALLLRRYAGLPERMAEHRCSALYLLSHCSKPGASALTEVLRNGDEELRTAAARYLGEKELADREAWAALFAALQDRSAAVRAAAADALGSLGMDMGDPVSRLTALLDDKDATVRDSATRALAEFGPWARCAVPRLLRMMADPFWVEVPLRTILAADDQAIATLIDALASPEVRVREGAAWALASAARTAAGASPNFLGALRPSPPEHWPETQELTVAVASLGQLLTDPDPSVRIAAAWALTYMGTPAIPEFVKALASQEIGTRRIAAQALVDVGVALAPCPVILVPPDPSKRDERLDSRHAVWSSEAFKQATPIAVAALTRALSDLDVVVRRDSARAIGWIGPAAAPAAIDPLKLRLADGDAQVRAFAVWALSEIGPGDPVLAEFHMAALRDQDSDVRWRAADALGHTSCPTRNIVCTLAECLRGDSCTLVRWSAARSLGGLGAAAAPATDALAAALKDQNSDVRSAAIEALGAIGPEARGALPALKELGRNQRLGPRHYYYLRKAIPSIEGREPDTDN